MGDLDVMGFGEVVGDLGPLVAFVAAERLNEAVEVGLEGWI